MDNMLGGQVRSTDSKGIAYYQEKLNKVLKLNPPLVVDGIMGPKTRFAIRQFQEQYGLVVDGLLGPQTIRILTQGVTKADSNWVAFYQKKLNRLMKLNPPLVVDGIMGEKTVAAIREFQKQHGLMADGIIGVDTKRAFSTYDPLIKSKVDIVATKDKHRQVLNNNSSKEWFKSINDSLCNIAKTLGLTILSLMEEAFKECIENMTFKSTYIELSNKIGKKRARIATNKLIEGNLIKSESFNILNKEHLKEFRKAFFNCLQKEIDKSITVLTSKELKLVLKEIISVKLLRAVPFLGIGLSLWDVNKNYDEFRKAYLEGDNKKALEKYIDLFFARIIVSASFLEVITSTETSLWGILIDLYFLFLCELAKRQFLANDGLFVDKRNYIIQENFTKSDVLLNIKEQGNLAFWKCMLIPFATTVDDLCHNLKK